MPGRDGAFDFATEVLPRLVAAYESGKLVPFIGVGMSRPLCASWPKLVEGLEKAAAIVDPRPLTDDTKPEELIQRANRGVETLRRGAPGALALGLRTALMPTAAPAVPMQTKVLAGIAWPLVLTTNYDNAYVKAYEDEFGAGNMAVVGRSAEDCQRVLNSLTTAGRSLLWALQGHIGEPFAVSTQERDRKLSSEAVVDHAEYRRVTNREPHFRRAFAEVFRHRSLLFLGSGLRENYLQELFGEVLEIYGPSTRTHFAIMPAGEVDPRFLYERFQVAVVEYSKGAHGEPPRMIGELRAAIDSAQQVPVAWSWGTVEHAQRDVLRSAPELEVIRGPLPLARSGNDCLVVSAGGRRDGREFVISSKKESTIRDTLAKWGVGALEQPAQIDADGYVGEYVDRNAFAVRARPVGGDSKNLSHIAPAAKALFDAVAERYDCMHVQLLAAGGAASEGPSWSIRPFPKRFPFIQMVREWGKWRRAHPSNRCKLALHVVDASVTRDIASGRLDVLEILRCDDIRVWAEVVESPERLERRLFQVWPEKTALREICSELFLTPSEWQLEVTPPPTTLKDDYVHPELSKVLDRRLDQLFVVSGSTLHFRRRA